MINMVLPRYQKGIGDVTDIHYLDRVETVSKSVDVVMEELMRTNCICPNEVNREARRITCKKKNNPTFVSPHEAFVQVKVRTPRTKGDPAYGFFNIDFVYSIVDGNIEMRSGVSVKSLESESVINERMRHGRLFRGDMMGKLKLDKIVYIPEENVIVINGKKIPLDKLSELVIINDFY